MSNAVDRLKLAEAVLALIEQKRAETGDESLGAAIEPWLIRRRRSVD